jgi:hypothetical protein
MASQAGDQIHCDPVGAAFRLFHSFDEIGVHD